MPLAPLPNQDALAVLTGHVGYFQLEHAVSHRLLPTKTRL